MGPGIAAYLQGDNGYHHFGLFEFSQSIHVNKGMHYGYGIRDTQVVLVMTARDMGHSVGCRGAHVVKKSLTTLFTNLICSKFKARRCPGIFSNLPTK